MTNPDHSNVLCAFVDAFVCAPGTKLSVARGGQMVMVESADGSKEATDLVRGSAKYTMANGVIVRIEDNLRVETRVDGSEHTEFVKIDEAGVTVCTYIVKNTAGKITTTRIGDCALVVG